MQRLQQIYDEQESLYSCCSVVTDYEKVMLALTVLGKYSKDISLTPCHDQLFIGFDNDSDYDKLTHAEIDSLFRVGWFIEDNSLATFFITTHMNTNILQLVDTDIKAAIDGELQRQNDGLELIPSENHVSMAVLEALGSVLTNKYSEGYPDKRYYGGQQFTDEVESLAIDRAKVLFNAKFANVQPLSGAMANIATYFALLEPGDTVLGMELSHGGHLTHGSPVTYMSKIFKYERYGITSPEIGTINYKELRETALRVKPKMILAGFSSYPRTLDWQKFVDIAKEVGAYAVADVAHIAGLIAGGVEKNPLDFGFDVMTTTTHKTLRGPRGGMILTNSPELAKKIDKAVFPGLQGGPQMNNIAAKAVCFKEAMQPSFKEYAKQIVLNANAMAKVFRDAGVKMITHGTDNHMIVLDTMASADMTGADAEKVLDSVGITVNKQVIPNDARKALDPSGIRLGVPAITSRGFKEAECSAVAMIIAAIILREEDLERAAHDVKALARAFPIPTSY